MANGETELGPYDDTDRVEIQRFVPHNTASMLDVGCLGGAFGAALKRTRPSLEVWGIEPNVTAAEMAARRLDRVIAGTFPDDAPARSFDCIVFNDVLEHMLDPWDAVARARDILAPHGTVIASIPNVRSIKVVWPLLRDGEWAYKDVGILDRTHVRFFTRSTMSSLFSDAGYRVEAITPIRIHPPRGRLPRLLHAIGRRGIEFLATEFVVVARPQP